RVLPPERAREVHEFARGQENAQAIAGLVVEQLPVGVADRRVLAQQVVAHRSAPLRLPSPSDPDPSLPDGSSSPVASASAASPCSTMSPGLNRIPCAISRRTGVRRSRASRSMLECLYSSPTASRM